jgi:hypothetical protein
MASGKPGAVHYRRDPCFECNPATWVLWSKRGIALRGVQPQGLGIEVDEAVLRGFQIANLDAYWRRWIIEFASQLAQKSRTGPADAGAIAWGILGISRIACTLATGCVVSKSKAGSWALSEYGREGEMFIRDALAARRGEVREVSIEHCLGALKFMEQVIASATSTVR